MKIKVEHPFDAEYVRAYLSDSGKDGRKRVTLHRQDNTGTVMSYARYLMSIKSKRILETWEEVDHIDENSTNDSLQNLQILSIEDHIKKTLLNRKSKEIVKLQCDCCKKFLNERQDYTGLGNRVKFFVVQSVTEHTIVLKK